MQILPGASRRIFHFSPSRAVPRALNDVKKPKRLGTRLGLGDNHSIWKTYILASMDYLPTLFERQKWNLKKRNLCVGDVVLVADDNFARGNWPLARVVEVITGQDGMVRVAKVKTASTVATYSKRKRNEELNTSIPLYLHVRLPSYVCSRWIKKTRETTSDLLDML